MSMGTHPTPSKHASWPDIQFLPREGGGNCLITSDYRRQRSGSESSISFHFLSPLRHPIRLLPVLARIQGGPSTNKVHVSMDRVMRGARFFTLAIILQSLLLLSVYRLKVDFDARTHRVWGFTSEMKQCVYMGQTVSGGHLSSMLPEYMYPNSKKKNIVLEPYNLNVCYSCSAQCSNCNMN